MARVLRQAGVAKDDLIWVTGPAGLTALIWLDRQGYVRASYAHANRIREMRPADVVMVPHACHSAELAAMFENAACVRDCGVLIVQVAGSPSAAILADPASMLVELGYEVEHRIAEKGRTVLVARRSGHGDLRLAA